jgi:hypothetical protein
MVQSDMLNIFRKDGAEESEGSKVVTGNPPEPVEQVLPAPDQTDLTSTPAPIQGAGDQDPLPVDKKTS